MSSTLRLTRFALLAVLASCEYGTPDSADQPPLLYATGSPDIVISQLYGGGGNSGAQFTRDFVELFNRSASAVSVTGWSVQYASTSGNSWAAANLSGTIPAGGYYLVQLAAGTGTSGALPTPDATGAMNMSGSTGKVALVSNQTLLRCGAGTACLPNAAIHDFVGYGTADNFEGSGDAPTGSNTTAEFRAAGGCTDTNSNAADFTTAAPAPRNSAHAHNACSTGGGGGTPPDAGVPDAPGGGGGGTGDGTPTRQPCSSTFGSAMTTAFGRLDGFLVAIVNPNTTSSCRGDDNHIHLQVRVNGGIQDIPVNVQSTSGNPDVDFRTLNSALRGGAWVEGWHPGQSLDYANTLGVSSTSFTEENITQLTTSVDNALASANHVSIFTTGFDATGGDLVHREGGNHDGAIVINPTTASPTYLLFHFTNQTF
ncbi:MAG TPA: lamin tail domain-containing protein [Kofleriaceae bacterium]|jgi:predicted extracellular nuclease|nr:lamin tail domain-containing protein [Kofleriaceae bacterium]